MIAPLILLLISLCGVAAAFLLPGLSDLFLLTGPMALASLYLLARAWMTRKTPKWIVVDGSNVMHWRDETPRIEALRDVLRHLEAAGFTPGVVFDANAGYLIAGKYQHDHAFGELLGLHQDRIMVVPKGTPADPTILTAARDLGARVVTNDRYRDWAGDFPEIGEPGFLIRGGYRDGGLWLDLDDDRPTRAAREVATAARG